MDMKLVFGSTFYIFPFSSDTNLSLILVINGDFSRNMNNEDIGVDNDVDVNNNSNAVNNGSNNDGAVIALSVILALLLLGIFAGFVFYKRKYVSALQ